MTTCIRCKQRPTWGISESATLCRPCYREQASAAQNGAKKRHWTPDQVSIKRVLARKPKETGPSKPSWWMQQPDEKTGELETPEKWQSRFYAQVAKNAAEALSDSQPIFLHAADHKDKQINFNKARYQPL